MGLKYVKLSSCKKLAKSGNRIMSKQFAEHIDRMVERKIKEAVAYHNGGRKTMKTDLAFWCGITPPTEP